MKIEKELDEILSKILTEGTPLIVGGSVRDKFIHGDVSSKDIDIEVYGIKDSFVLEKILSSFGKVSIVGKSFGVIKLTTPSWDYDFSFPRTEQKTGTGHRGFDVSIDANLSYEDAFRRRDFTMNAIGFDFSSKDFVDPFNGIRDIEKGIIRHINSDSFMEDPLRVYRAIQFSSRFGFSIAKETEALCRKMVKDGLLDELPQERVFEEWKKMLLKSKKPSVGFELMKEWGITERYFPELEAISGVPQSPKWHPEGDVWVHTMMRVDEMASLVEEKQFDLDKRVVMLLSILTHDFGKPATTTYLFKDGTVTDWCDPGSNSLNDIEKISAIGHEPAGIGPTEIFIGRLTKDKSIIQEILPLVEHHLKPSSFYSPDESKRAKSSAFKRLATKVNLSDLAVIGEADFLGRTTEESLSRDYKAGKWFLSEAEKLNVKNDAIPSLLQGRDLISVGMKPSPAFKDILNDVYEKQLAGELEDKESAIEYVRNKI